MRWIVLALGIICVLLGGLWLLQGLAIVEIEPILCVGECEPVEGGSALWAVVGGLVVGVGVFAIVRSLRRRPRSR